MNLRPKLCSSGEVAGGQGKPRARLPEAWRWPRGTASQVGLCSNKLKTGYKAQPKMPLESKTAHSLVGGKDYETSKEH